MNISSSKMAIAAMIAVAALIALIGVAQVNWRQRVIELGYQLSQATEELTRKQEENRRLRLERSVLTNPDRIATFAQTLGLGQPEPGQIRVIRGGNSHADQ